jgi:energy-coupling factor transporter ATP-binding protein EcfA2
LREPYNKLNSVLVIRQVLLYPPLVLNPPMNKRTGRFEKIDQNPLQNIDVNKNEWLCYPAKVGPLIIHVYFHERFYELGFSLCNLFELANDEELQKKPDAVYAFGVPDDALDNLGTISTVFYDDVKNDLLVAAVPNRDEFGYFGYLKKMVLTLHNIKMMKSDRFPFHGALVKIILKNDKEATVLIIGDTGAGKSETLEAFRVLGKDYIKEMTIIADDMGSLETDSNDDIIGYGTEIGAFLRLDDLQPGFAFGQIDRSIFMSPSQINARIVLPITTFENVIRGHKIDFIFYANNYEEVDGEHPIIERFNSPKQALQVFKEGAVMSKGTTTSKGLVHSYFANIFGPPQYREIHDKLAIKYFNAFFKKDVFVGQMRTRLGIPGYEITGPELAAKELLNIFNRT